MTRRWGIVLVALGTWTLSACGGGGGSGGAGGKATSSSTGGAGGACEDTGERPGPRAESFGAFDEKRGRFVFYGGDSGLPKQCQPSPHPIGETWVYDARCKTFTQPATTTDPGGRARGVGVYDAAGDRVVVFGGRYRAAASGNYQVFGDVWAFDLAKEDWAQLDTGTGPTGRSSTAAAFDDAKHELVVYGGNASTSGLAFTPLGDTWAFDVVASTWRKLTTTGDPKPRLFHAAAIDPDGRRLFVYGGGDANAFTGPFFKDLWALDLDGGAWTELSTGASGPRGRIQASLVFDKEGGRLLLFGGHDDGSLGNENDTWAFDLATSQWTDITAPEPIVKTPTGFCNFPPDFTTPNTAAPERRSQHAAGFDRASRSWYVFGGATDCGLIDDVWLFDGAASAWSNQVPATYGESCARTKGVAACTTLCQ